MADSNSGVDGSDEALVGQVNAVENVATSTAVEVTTIVGQVADITAARNVEAFDHVAFHVILEEVVRGAAPTPVAGVDVFAIGGHTILGTFGSVEGSHFVPKLRGLGSGRGGQFRILPCEGGAFGANQTYPVVRTCEVVARLVSPRHGNRFAGAAAVDQTHIESVDFKFSEIDDRHLHEIIAGSDREDRVAIKLGETDLGSHEAARGNRIDGGDIPGSPARARHIEVGGGGKALVQGQ